MPTTSAKREIGDLFAALGFALWMADEAKLGGARRGRRSGPAYVARFIAALTKAGEKRGLEHEIAATIARRDGARHGWMAATTSEDMDSIARRVASPKGTTEAGLAVLDRDRCSIELIASTIEAAARRGAELAAEAAALACRGRAPVLGALAWHASGNKAIRRPRRLDLAGRRDGAVARRATSMCSPTRFIMHRVFEGQRAYNGEIFKLNEHSERLRKSASLLGFELPWTVEEIDAACNEVLKANGLTDAYMRPLAWRGSESMGVAPGKTKPHLAIAAWEWGKYYDPRKSEQGHPARDRAVAAAGALHRADRVQGRGPVHDLHLVQAACGGSTAITTR